MIRLGICSFGILALLHQIFLVTRTRYFRCSLQHLKVRINPSLLPFYCSTSTPIEQDEKRMGIKDYCEDFYDWQIPTFLLDAAGRFYCDQGRTENISRLKWGRLLEKKHIYHNYFFKI